MVADVASVMAIEVSILAVKVKSKRLPRRGGEGGTTNATIEYESDDRDVSETEVAKCGER